MDFIDTRGGVDFIGYYSCTTRQRRALRQLGQPVVEPAVDWELYRLLKPLYPELDPRKDNRSVTDPEWVVTGLSKYGCPVHETKFGVQSAEPRTVPGASGHGFCSCSTRDKRERDREREFRNSSLQGSGKSWKSGGHTRNDQGSEHSRGSDRTSTRPSYGGTAFPLDEDSSRYGKDVDGRRFDPDSYRHGLRAAFSSIVHRTRRSKPLSVDEVVEKYIHMDHSAGAPYFSRNSAALPAALEHAAAIVRGDRDFDPYVAQRRVQHGRTGPKTRLVWAAPLATTLLATRFSKVIHKRLERRRPFSWGLDGIERGTLVSEITGKYEYTYSLDFSGFDSSIPAKVIRDSFNIMREFLELNEEDEVLWNKLIHDFIHTRLLTHDRKVYRVHKGVPSGSAFTSQIDSIANVIILNYMFIRLTGRALRADEFWVLGDDAIIGSNYRLSLQQLASAASELGIIVSVEKSKRINNSHMGKELVDMPHYLGHHYSNSQPRRDPMDLVKRMVFPERHYKQSRSLSYIRFLSYGADAIEWWEIAARVFPRSRPTALIYAILERIDRDIDMNPRDLPGLQRYLSIVEGADVPYQIGRKGMKPPLVGRFA